MAVIRKTTKAVLSGIAFTLIGIVGYILLHGLINFQPNHAEGLRVILYSPWFLLSAVGGFAFGVYLVTSKIKSPWKALTAIFSGGAFAIIGLAIYVVSQIDWHPPGYALVAMEWKPYSPWLWISTLFGCGFGVWLALRKKKATQE